MVLLSIITLAVTQSLWFLFLLLVEAIVWIAILLWIDVDIAKAAERLRELEAEINSMATGVPLLKWETLFGMGGIAGKRVRKWLAERRARKLARSTGG